jgi:60 kDa SS-A/Ro ribonucleoprotein
MRANAKGKDHRVDFDHRTAGGRGVYAAKQTPEQMLRRSVMANLLWEDNFYEDGESTAKRVKDLVPHVDPEITSKIAIEARNDQKLRHVPLLITREMARHKSHQPLVRQTMREVIKRADEINEFVALYYQDGKQPLAMSVRKGLQDAFTRFKEYNFAKYDRDQKIKFRDVMNLVHPKPPRGKEGLYNRIHTRTLKTPDTWEVRSSKKEQSKKQMWEEMIREGKLGALAFVKNLRNMEEAGVDHQVMLHGFKTVKTGWLFPIDVYKAAKYAPAYSLQLEDLAIRILEGLPKMPGRTIFVVDVSGSMDGAIAKRSDMNRLEVAGVMVMFASYVCEDIAVYVTAGSDFEHEHKTGKLVPRRGFAIVGGIRASKHMMGGGGIFTRQCLEWIREQEKREVDRIIVFSDSQDTDHPHLRIPAPFGKTNYIIDVSAHAYGVAYEGVWTAEISGWSEHFLKYIMALEGLDVQQQMQ